MTQLEMLQAAVKDLSKPDFDAFKHWLVEYEFDQWTEQIERDSYDQNSPIMKMSAQALEEHKNRKTKKL
jgi:hypothetical protein